MRSLVEAHDRVKDFDWEPTYAEQPVRYPTKYKIPQDDQGSLPPPHPRLRDDGARRRTTASTAPSRTSLARSNAPAKAERRWMEIMKPAIPIVNFGEYAAMKSCGQLIDTVDNAELRQGYMAQMLDEVRHTNQETYLTRYFAKHAAEPDGFAHSMKIKGTNMFNRAGRAALENFFVGDPIEGALNLQVVAETAYTNPIFVAMTEVAALQGRPVHAQRVPEHPVRRGPAHGQRLLHAGCRRLRPGQPAVAPEGLRQGLLASARLPRPVHGRRLRLLPDQPQHQLQGEVGRVDRPRTGWGPTSGSSSRSA